MKLATLICTMFLVLCCGPVLLRGSKLCGTDEQFCFGCPSTNATLCQHLFKRGGCAGSDCTPLITAHCAVSPEPWCSDPYLWQQCIPSNASCWACPPGLDYSCGYGYCVQNASVPCPTPFRRCPAGWHFCGSDGTDEGRCVADFGACHNASVTGNYKTIRSRNLTEYAPFCPDSTHEWCRGCPFDRTHFFEGGDPCFTLWPQCRDPRVAHIEECLESVVAYCKAYPQDWACSPGFWPNHQYCATDGVCDYCAQVHRDANTGYYFCGETSTCSTLGSYHTSCAPDNGCNGGFRCDLDTCSRNHYNRTQRCEEDNVCPCKNGHCVHSAAGSGVVCVCDLGWQGSLCDTVSQALQLDGQNTAIAFPGVHVQRTTSQHPVYRQERAGLELRGNLRVHGTSSVLGRLVVNGTDINARIQNIFARLSQLESYFT